MGDGAVVAGEFLRELEAEVRATRESLAGVPMGKRDWKPHERSMELGYLAELISDMPRWLTYAVEKGEVDFETYPQYKAETVDDVLAHFDECVDGARKSLGGLTDDRLDETFTLRRGEQTLMEMSIRETISSSINHMVHHRGQLSVYLRLLDVKVPSLYGPSADTGGF